MTSQHGGFHSQSALAKGENSWRATGQPNLFFLNNIYSLHLLQELALIEGANLEGTAPKVKVQLPEYENQTLEAFVAASRLPANFDCLVSSV